MKCSPPCHHQSSCQMAIHILRVHGNTAGFATSSAMFSGERQITGTNHFPQSRRCILTADSWYTFGWIFSHRRGKVSGARYLFSIAFSIAFCFYCVEVGLSTVKSSHMVLLKHWTNFIKLYQLRWRFIIIQMAILKFRVPYNLYKVVHEYVYLPTLYIFVHSDFCIS